MKCSVQAINDTFGGGLRRKTIVAYIGRCVAPDTKITIRNKKTQKIEEISIFDFYSNFYS